MFKKIVLGLCFVFIGCNTNAQKKAVTSEVETKAEKSFAVTKSKAEWRNPFYKRIVR